ncbi:cilia- and flagella-associated protein 251-like [Cardiocondyla obscurior]|uniref:cilia- and flagella-associated protein 251-like n=1 Tax=Cardiocondyla obscurior TaxID=286306 RepID=UPI0039657751
MKKKKYKIKERKLGHKDWWNKECTKKKRKTYRCLRRWKKGLGQKETYIKEHKKWRSFMEKCRERKRKEKEEELKSLKNGKNMWNFINKKRRKREDVLNDIKKEEWEEYFARLLDGKKMVEQNKKEDQKGKKRYKIKAGRGREEKENGKEELKKEEIMQIVWKMKKKKAAGIDEIPMEAWMYEGKATAEGLVEIIKKYGMKYCQKTGKTVNGWGKALIDSIERENLNIIEEVKQREREIIQGQIEGNRIDKARYNVKYKKYMYEDGIPEYMRMEELNKINNGEGVRALIGVRCGNIEEKNTYWLEEKERICTFCNKGDDDWDHFIKGCEITKEWFRELEKREEKRMDRFWNGKLDKDKCKVLLV